MISVVRRRNYSLGREQACEFYIIFSLTDESILPAELPFDFLPSNGLAAPRAVYVCWIHISFICRGHLGILEICFRSCWFAELAHPGPPRGILSETPLEPCSAQRASDCSTAVTTGSPPVPGTLLCSPVSCSWDPPCKDVPCCFSPHVCSVLNFNFQNRCQIWSFLVISPENRPGISYLIFTELARFVKAKDFFKSRNLSQEIQELLSGLLWQAVYFTVRVLTYFKCGKHFLSFAPNQKSFYVALRVLLLPRVTLQGEYWHSSPCTFP